MKKLWPGQSHQLIFLIISGAIFSIAYAVHSDMSGSMSKPELPGTFQAFWPYKPRFLVAWIAYHLFGTEIINSISFRAALAFVCWIPSALLSIRFAQRLKVSAAAMPYVVVSFVLITLAHYCLPNVAAQYYIYDMPAILFYLIVFLLLTSDKRWQVLLGGVFTLVFTMNREPIAIALFHSLAWWFVQYWERSPRSNGNQSYPWSLARYLVRGSISHDNRFLPCCALQ